MKDGINVLRPAQVAQEAPEPAEVPSPPEDDEGWSYATTPAPPFEWEVADSTVDEVMLKVEAGVWDAAAVYVAEEDGKHRKTLLVALESYSEQRG